MRFLYPTFPRELAIPGRVMIHSYEDFVKVVDKFNRYRKIWYSLYQYDGEYGIVDKLFFDLDGDNCHQEIQRFHNYLIELNLKHVMFFSGRGYHCYIKCKPKRIHKDILYSAQMHFFDKLNMLPDVHTLGNVAQTAAVPNTFNTKRMRFCIPVSESIINGGLEQVKIKALSQNFEYTIYGNSEYDFNDTVMIKRKYKQEYFDFDEGSENSIKLDKEIIYRELRPCIQRLCYKNANFRQRYHIIVEVMNLGFTYSQCIDFLKTFLSEEKFLHCVCRYNEVSYIYKKPELFRSSCKIMTEEGLCNSALNCVNILLFNKPQSIEKSVSCSENE